MAGAKPGVHLCQLKLPQVHPDLVMGSKFVKIDEDNPSAISCYYVLLKVDPKGYIAYWKDVQTGQHETDFIDLYMLRDVRTGKLARLPKDSKVNDVCSTFGDSVSSIEDKTVTVCWGNDFVNLQWASFVAGTAEIAKLWCQELFAYAYNLLSVNVSVGIFYERAWTKLYYTQQENKISIKHVLRLFANHKDDKDRVMKCLQNAGINVTVSPHGEFIPADQLVLSRFIEFCCSLSIKQDIQQVFEEICPQGSSMTTEQLVCFLNSHQRDPRLNELLYPYWNHVRARPLIEKYELDEELKSQGLLSLAGFVQLLISEDNNIAPFDELDLSHEMSHPLSHYYIASSHNTYLTGHQLTGKSSVEMYRQVLLSGCRCVELDCWDGRQPDDEPIIKHGFTMVTEIPLKEALDAINDCAFRTSDFPVILSLENHCSPRQQTKIAQHLRNVFGPALLTEPLPGYPTESGVPLPPPSLLLRRILIKNKKITSCQPAVPTTAPILSSTALSADQIRASSYRARADSNSSLCKPKVETPTIAESPMMLPSPDDGSMINLENTLQSPTVTQAVGDSDGEADSGDEYSGAPHSIAGSSGLSTTGFLTANSSLSPHQQVLANSLSSCSLVYPHDTVPHPAVTATVSNKRRPSKHQASYTAVKDLSDLVNYVQPVHFISFEAAAARNHAFETSSISETTCFNLLKLYPVEFVNYNKRQLSRVYPRGTRVDSHNYLPFLFWVAGCQMVALNYQILDLGMQLYLGCFEFNARCGYLLKPPCMVQKTANFSPFLESATDHSVVAATVSVRIISGQLLSPRRISTYCEVEMYGLPSDSVRKKFRTKLVPNNGFNPAYSSDYFVFGKVVLPRLAILRFVVYDDTNRFVGHRILPVEQLKPGYRFVGLRSEANQPIPSASLLVYIKVHDFLADSHRELADALANPIAYFSKLDARAKQLEVLDFDESAEQQQPVFTLSSASSSGATASSTSGTQQSNANKSSLLVTQSNPVIQAAVPTNPQCVIPATRQSLPIGSEPGAEKSIRAPGGGRLSTAGLERIQRQRPDELPPISEICNSTSCLKLTKKRDQLLSMLRRKCAKVDFGSTADPTVKNEKVVAMWRKCYAEQRGVAVKYSELLTTAALSTLSSVYHERCKQLSNLFRVEERELRRLLSRERSARLKQVASSPALSDVQNPDSGREELARKKRQLQQELIDRAVDEITNMKEAAQTMEQRLRLCYEDRQRELEDWRRKMENELEQQYAAVLANLENASASGTLAALHASERMNQFRSGSVVIGGSSSDYAGRFSMRTSSAGSSKSLDQYDNGSSETCNDSTANKSSKNYSGMMALLPPIDEPVSPDDPEKSVFGLPSCTLATSDPQDPGENINECITVTEFRLSRSSIRRSFRRLLSCFR